jgi:DNA-binding response OmpR family regulator
MDDVDSVRVFVAEDQPEMRALIARVLRQDGYEVIEASDGTALIDSLVRSMVDDARMPDLIITDIRMPGASGLDVVARLRRSDWTTPIIFITAFGDDQAHAEARRLGAVGCLDKPFDLDELRAMVRSLHEPR